MLLLNQRNRLIASKVFQLKKCPLHLTWTTNFWCSVSQTDLSAVHRFVWNKGKLIHIHSHYIHRKHFGFLLPKKNQSKHRYYTCGWSFDANNFALLFLHNFFCAFFAFTYFVYFVSFLFIIFFLTWLNDFYRKIHEKKHYCIMLLSQFFSRIFVAHIFSSISWLWTVSFHQVNLPFFHCYVFRSVLNYFEFVYFASVLALDFKIRAETFLCVEYIYHVS